MPERSESKAVDRSCRLFRRLLVAYPKAHREEFGAAILQLFRDQCRDAWAAARTRGLIGFWLRALADLLKTSVWEHLSNANRRKIMLNLFRTHPRLLLVFVSVFAAVFLLAVGGSTFVTLIYPKMYASTARIEVNHTVVQPSSAFSSDPWLPEVEFEVIQSHAVLSKASEALGLSKLWGKKYNHGQPLDESDVEAMIKSRLELGTIRNTHFIQIRAFSDNPADAAKLANGVVEAYRDFRAAEVPQNATAPVERRVSIIDPAVPQPKAVRPNIPLNIVLGMMIGILMGGFSGTVAVAAMWLLGRRLGKTGSPNRPASSDMLA